MAWIAIHDSIDGPKLRKFSKELGCSTCEAEGVLSRLWRWCKENADDSDGKIMYADKKDISVIFEGRVSANVDCEKIVKCLIKSGWIDEIDGELFVHDWTTWQEHWIKAKIARAKDAERKRKSRLEKMQEELKQKKAAKPVIKERPPATKELAVEEEKKSGIDYSTEFLEFWSVYPKKMGKGEAFKKFKARLNDGFPAEQLITAAKKYANSCKAMGTDEKYIKHAKTFLSENLPFTDYIDHFDEPPKKSSDNPFAEWEDDD